MKTALVTGAAQGIGRATSERLLKDGYQLVASDMLEAGLEELRAIDPKRVAIIKQDVTAETAPDEAIALATSKFGGLNLLVNNAGIGHGKPVHDTDDALLDRFLNVNVRAQFRFSRSALKVMKPGAAIVHIASIFGLRGSVGSGAYAVSKAAMVGLTRQMATDYGPQGIRVNAVAPGLIQTPLTRERIESDKVFRKRMVETTPFPRVGRPEDIAAAVSFLASDDASFVSGHILVVDGGWLAGNNPQG